MKKGAFSKFIIILVIVLNVIFTGYLLYIMPQLTFEPSTLIISWFGFTSGEAGLVALIKIFKVKKKGGTRTNESEDVIPDE